MHSFYSKTRRQNAVPCRGRAAALEVTKHATARLFACALRDFARYDFANSAKPKFAAFDVAFHLLAMLRSRAFGDNDDRAQISSRAAHFDDRRDLFEIERDLRNQNDISPAGNTAV